MVDIRAHRAMYQSWRNATCHFSHFQLRRHLHLGYVLCTCHEAPPFTRIMTDPTILCFEFGPGLIVMHWPDLEADRIAYGSSLAGQDPPIKEQFPSPPSASFLSLFTLRALRSHTCNFFALVLAEAIHNESRRVPPTPGPRPKYPFYVRLGGLYRRPAA